MNKKAVVLLSGGLDSTTVLAIARQEGYEIYALSFDYGQRHKNELRQAELIAQKAKVRKHLTVKCDLTLFGGSALTADIAVPKGKKESEIGQHLPVTYVPARNTIFLSLALAWCETLPCNNIFIGVNAVDYSGYPDCRPEFIGIYEKMANTAMSLTQDGSKKIRIHTPLMHMSKKEIIETGNALGVDYADTITCYDYTEEGACGLCEACILRLNGFKQANLKDPGKYR